MTENLRAFLRGEPVAVGAFVAAVLAAGILLGLDLDEAEVTALVTALLGVVGWATRRHTTPASDPTEPAERQPTTRL